MNRQYFDPSKSIEIHGFPVKLWPGYVSSIRQTANGVSLINDVSHKVFRTGFVLFTLKRIKLSYFFIIIRFCSLFY